jgi:hypothetical protein
MKVVKKFRNVYFNYIQAYIKAVKSKDSEAGIKNLGPPREPYLFATPKWATKKQTKDIAEIQIKSSSVRAWIAIADRLAILSNQVPEGTPFFMVKFTQEAEISASVDTGKVGAKSYGKIVVETSWFVTPDGLISKKPETKTEVGGGVTVVAPKGTKIGVEVKHEKDKTTVGATLGKYGAEISDNGDFEANVGVAKGGISEGGSRMVTGVEIPLPGGQKAYIGIGFQGVRDDTILAFFSRAPSFFDRKTLSELTQTYWSELGFQEQQKLQNLGWTQEKWNHRKNLPESTKTGWRKLTPKQQMSALDLGFRSTSWNSWNWKTLPKKN